MNRTLPLLALCVLLASGCGGRTSATASPAPGETGGEATRAPASGGTATPTLPPPTIPPDFLSYEDPEAGFAVHYPSDWVVASQEPGNLVILQSFLPSEGGSEGIPAGETKCDVIVRPDISTVEQATERVTSESEDEVLAQIQIARADGGAATVLQLGSDRAGEYGMVLTEVEGRVVMMSCLGDQEDFDVVASGLQPLR